MSVLNLENANKIFDAVYQHSLYDINFFQPDLIDDGFSLNSEDDIRHKNYTLVMSQPDFLFGYVNNHIGDYLDMVLSSCDGSIVDDESIVLSVLNNEGINIWMNKKGQYINLCKLS